MNTFFKSLDISASGLTAQRFRMDVLAQNIANATTTRTESGDPYRRRYVVFAERQEPQFAAFLESARSAAKGRGVDVVDTGEDDAPFKLSYDPGHPDADEDGYVRLPNVDTAREMIDMMVATRAYEANITMINNFKAMATKTLELGR